MTGLFRFFNSSIGKKMLVGLTGLMLCVFLVGHLLGNLLLFKGPEMFDHYAETLRANPFLVPIELGLLAIFVIHITFTIRVTLANRAARPVGYAMDNVIGQRNVSSATMIYSGLLLLLFVIVHLKNFKYASFAGSDLYSLVIRTFQQPFWALLYVFFMLVLMSHLRHGFRSAFQSLGALWGAVDPPVRCAGAAFAVIIAGGFLLIPIWAFLFGHLPPH